MSESLAKKFAALSLADKALKKLVSEHWDHTNFKVVHSRRGGFGVTGDLYHDCDRAPSYTTIDVVMDRLKRMEADKLVELLEAQTEKLRKARDDQRAQQ